MDHKILEGYIRKIERSRYAPDKPFLMLAVIQLMEQGEISENRISLSDHLDAIFRKYISLMPGLDPKIHDLFDDLKNEGFWHLKNWSPTAGAEYNGSLFSTVPDAKQPEFKPEPHAVLNDDLFSLLDIRVYRELIRQTIIETYFPKLRQRIEDFAVEESAKTYSETLISGAEDEFLLFKCPKLIKEKPPVRSAGFRRAIMRIYDHTCAVCKLNIRAPSGASVTDAAHIIPFSDSYNDDIRNGMSLCKSHHWAFDAGLIAVNEDYKVIVSRAVNEQGPTEAMLTGLQNKLIRLPKKMKYRPHQRALKWHREEIYERVTGDLLEIFEGVSAPSTY